MDTTTLREVLAMAKTLSEEEQRQLAASLPPPVGPQVGRVWYLLIIVLALLAAGAGYGAFNLIIVNQADAAAGFLAITTAVVGGLIGLFAPSPVANK